jgi:hypothetical protein
MQYVVKASSPYIDDHIINSHLFNLLSIPGVHAPSVVKLTPEFEGKLLLLSDKSGEVDLFTALKGGNNQLAAKAPGYSIEDIQGDFTYELKLLNGIVEENDAKNSLITLFESLTKPQYVKQLEWDSLQENFVKAKNSKQRQKAIDAIKNVVISPTVQTRLSVMGRLNAGGVKGVQQRLTQVQSQLEDLATAREVLNSRMATKDGAYALGALCAVDLLCGMNDRILSKWNGGNFMFDPETSNLWCIDNAKNADLGLSSGKETGPGGWVEFATNLKRDSGTNQLTDMIYFYVYGGGASGQDGFLGLIPDEKKQDIEAAIGAAVEYTLTRIRKLVEGGELDPVVTSKLSKRLDFLEGKADIVNDASSSKGQTVSLSTSGIISSPGRQQRTPQTFGLSGIEQSAVKDAMSTPWKKPIRRQGPVQTTSTNMSISTKASSSSDSSETEQSASEDSISPPRKMVIREKRPAKTTSTIISNSSNVSSPRLTRSPQLSNSSEPTTISTTSIVTSPRPVVQFNIAKPPRLKKGVFQEIGERTTGPRLGLQSTQAHTEKSLFADAQSIWGNEPLPSDDDSKEKIISTMEKVEQDPNASSIDIVRRLSVELKINHPDLPESSKGLGKKSTSGDTKGDSSEKF